MFKKRNKQEQVEVGAEAKRLLEHPLIAEFFDTAEQRLFHQFKSVQFDGSFHETLAELKYQQMALEAFKSFFHKVITDANMAAKEIAKENWGDQ